MVLQELVCKINVFVFSTIQRVKQTVCQAKALLLNTAYFHSRENRLWMIFNPFNLPSW